MLKAEMLAKQCDEDPMPIGTQYLPEWMTTPEAIEEQMSHVAMLIEMLDGERDVIFMYPNEELANRLKKAYPECEIRFVREMDKNKIVVTKKKHLRMQRGK